MGNSTSGAWGFLFFVGIVWGLCYLLFKETTPQRKEPREDGLDTPEKDEVFEHYPPTRRHHHHEHGSQTTHAQSKVRQPGESKVKTKFERPWARFDRLQAAKRSVPVVVKQDAPCGDCETGPGVLSAAVGLGIAALEASRDSSRVSDSETITGGGGSFDGGGASGSYDSNSGGSTFTDTGSSCSVTPDP